MGNIPASGILMGSTFGKFAPCHSDHLYPYPKSLAQPAPRDQLPHQALKKKVNSLSNEHEI